MEDNFEREYGEVIAQLLWALKDKIGRILLVALAAAMLSWSVSSFLIPQKYEASVNMIVNAQSDATGIMTNDSIMSAQNLVDTYAIIIKSNIVLGQVIEELGLEMTYDELAENVSVYAINSTLVMRITARSSDPALARQVAQCITEVAPEVVMDAVEAGSCKVVSHVYGNDEPVSPNILKNTAMAGFLGLLAAAALVILAELRNDHIVDEMDAEKRLGMAVLGIIPEVEGK